MPDRPQEEPHGSDSLTPLAASAAKVHELWSAYVAAGFTEQQALYLVAQIVIAAD